MDPQLASALVAVADWFDHHQVPFGLCGSAMLSLLGLEVEVGDLDLAVSGEAEAELALAPWPRLAPEAASPLFGSDWLKRFDVDGTTLECIGSLRVLLGGRFVDVPFEGGPVTTVAGRQITLVRPEVWYHVYRVYRPERADALGTLIGSEAIAAGGRVLGL